MALDADQRDNQANYPINEQVVLQEAWRRRPAVRMPLNASGMRAMMIRALKMTADSIALAGVPVPSTLSTFNAG